MWTKNIFTSVFSRLRANGNIRLKIKYPKITFTNSTPKSTISTFPTVIVSKLQGSEVGRDLEGSFINGILSNIQIEVVTNTNQDDADYIADMCLDMMKSMRYDMVGEPYENSTNDNEYRNVARYRRMVADNDII